MIPIDENVLKRVFKLPIKENVGLIDGKLRYLKFCIWVFRFLTSDRKADRGRLD